jgi:hypothetical protein
MGQGYNHDQDMLVILKNWNHLSENQKKILLLLDVVPEEFKAKKNA